MVKVYIVLFLVQKNWIKYYLAGRSGGRGYKLVKRELFAVEFMTDTIIFNNIEQYLL